MSGICRLARSFAHDFGKHGVTALAVSPGLTRTEAIVAAMGERPPGSDSVEFVGRVVRALYADPDASRYAGRTVPVAELAETYGIVDMD